MSNRKKNAQSTKKTKTGIPKIATQIDGLDNILHGGVPAGRTTLVGGGPGTGKSMLGLEFIYRGAMSGNPGIFLTFEETAESIHRNVATFGWDLFSLEQTGALFLLEGEVKPQVLFSGDYNINGLLAIIEGKAQEMGARRMVIDAMDILMRFFDDPGQQQNEIFALHKWLKDRRMTTVLTTKKDTDTSSRHSYLDFMADCVINLNQRVSKQVTTKRLQVIKYRGSGYDQNEYPFFISDDGLHFNSISNVQMHYVPGSERISSGHPSLDVILGGGYQRGTSILISGLTGTGKTSLACTFARSAYEKDQKVLYVNYEESRDGMVAGMLSIGIDLGPAIKHSALRVISMMPESLGIEAQLFRVISAVKRFEPEHLIVDAISAVKRIAGETAAFDFLLRLVNACRNKGITVFLVNQSRGPYECHEFSGIGISSIIDTIITLHYKDTGNEISRFLLIRKSRGTKHSNKYHDYVLTDNGIQFDMVQQPEASLTTY